MSLISDIGRALFSGAMVAAKCGGQGHQSQSQSHGRAWSVEGICGQIGWEIDERLGNAAVLHFRDSLIRIRKVNVVTSDSGKIASFTTFSAASLRERQVDVKLLAYLLARNGEVAAGAWGALADDSGVMFVLKYCAFTDGVDPGVFKYICESMVKEAHDFDTKLRSLGLL